MIPIFPSFKKVSLDDESDIKSYTGKYKPHSDFNFTSLWSWDVLGERKISNLNGNLVAYFTDYDSNEPFLSFMGENKVNETLFQIIEYSKRNNLSPVIDLVGEESVVGLDEERFLIEPSEGNTDYIFSVSELAFLNGKKFKSKRNLSRNFLTNNRNVDFKCIPLAEQRCANSLFALIDSWEIMKINNGKDYSLEHEKISIKRLVESKTNNNNLFLSTVSIEGSVVGFSVDEILTNNYAISHFIKADISYKGIYEFMNERIAEFLQESGVIYWNWEQDLGVESLKANKLSYHPVDFIKKFKITLK